MRDILAGGILVTADALSPLSRKPAYSRRRRAVRKIAAVRSAPKVTCNDVQPGQLVSPLLKFGFPSLAVH